MRRTGNHASFADEASHKANEESRISYEPASRPNAARRPATALGTMGRSENRSGRVEYRGSKTKPPPLRSRPRSRHTIVDSNHYKNIDHGMEMRASYIPTAGDRQRNQRNKSIYGIAPAEVVVISNANAREKVMHGMPQRLKVRPNADVLYRIGPPAKLTEFGAWLDKIKAGLERQLAPSFFVPVTAAGTATDYLRAPAARTLDRHAASDNRGPGPARDLSSSLRPGSSSGSRPSSAASSLGKSSVAHASRPQSAVVRGGRPTTARRNRPQSASVIPEENIVQRLLWQQRMAVMHGELLLRHQAEHDQEEDHVGGGGRRAIAPGPQADTTRSEDDDDDEHSRDS